MVKEKEKIRERRSAPRANCDFAVEIAHEDSSVLAHVVNISSSGMYLQSNAPISLFREIGIGIKLPGIDKIIECTGVVVRSEKEAAKNRFNIAIFFDDIEKDDKEKITKYVEKKLGG